ncbi:MAG: type I restriction enzyme HsdR N-terminal domain-containing protein [Dehalococcoidia bacterium]|nr:type I restriction enzyme HsdR N-terminal domain-containing protein [Dehalococcoidia bacterium]
MRKHGLDKDIKKAILEARSMIEAIAKVDASEAETRRRIDHIFEVLMGYDRFKHLTEEYAIKGAGDTTHCDIAIQLGHEEESKPEMFVECKRVNINITQKHIGQAASYAINYGCEWVLLTNSKDWKLYHITFGQPPQTKLIESWNLLTDDPLVLAKKFQIISYKNVRNKGLDTLWEKRNVLTTSNMLKAILSEESIKLCQRRLKKSTDVNISPEDIVGQFRHLLNEAALSEMNNIKILLPARQQRAKTSKAPKLKASSIKQQVEAILAEKQSKDQES